MSVFQDNQAGSVPAGGGSGADDEATNLDMEQMTDEERRAYLTAKLGSAAAADAYLRAAVGPDQAVDSQFVDNNAVSKVVGCQEFRPDTSLSTRISRHYTLASLSTETVYTKYQIVPHQGLSIPEIMCNLKYLANNSLDPIRDWNSTVRIGSGFRSNSSTDHGRGSAADLYFYQPGTSNRLSVPQLAIIARRLISEVKIPFTQLLLETSGNGTGWIHVANRRVGGNSAMHVGFSLNNGGNFHPGLPSFG